MRKEFDGRCEVCGVQNGTKVVRYRAKYGQVLCDKHFMQLKTKGAITDKSPRGCYDLNDYTIQDGIVFMELYNRQEEVIGITKFDEEFLPLLKSRKWRPTKKSKNKYYAVTIGSPESGLSHEYMHRIIAQKAGLDISEEIDHINGDSLDNRLSNLRPLSGADQKLNMKPKWHGQIPIRGVSFSTTDKNYHVDFAMHKTRYYCKHFATLEEAVCARYAFEKELTPELSLAQSYPRMKEYIEKVEPHKRQEIYDYIHSIIARGGYAV